MDTPRSFGIAVLAAVLVGLPAGATTKSSGGHSSSSGASHASAPAGGYRSGSPSAYHGASPATGYGGTYHGAAPANGYGYRPGYYNNGGYGYRPGYVAGGSGWRGYYTLGYGGGVGYPYSRSYWGWGYRYYPWAYASAPLPPAYASAPAPAVVATVGAQGQLVSGGGAIGVNLIIEGERLGVMADFNNLAVGDGSGNYDQTRTLDAHLTYALISDPHGRLRLEGGVDSAMLGSSILVGPGVGVSAGLGLLGPVGLEGALRVTPWPYHALDASAGLSLGLGPLGLRGGWRYTAIDGAGLANTPQQVNTFSGPYVGLALTI
jgi:hypothetical protein